jgi:hypothetical protein
LGLPCPKTVLPLNKKKAPLSAGLFDLTSA